MKICLKKLLISLLICICFISCHNGNSNQKIDNLTAFSKMYGYIRYFHPSDEAASVDWDSFVVNGVEKVKNAKNNEELEKILKELFYPIAPTIQIYKESEEPKIPSFPKDTTGLNKVFWQHFGLGTDEIPKNMNIYKSIRTNRNINNSENGFLCYRKFDPADFQNGELVFKLKLKAEFADSESFFTLKSTCRTIKNFMYDSLKYLCDTIRVNGKVDALISFKVPDNLSEIKIGFNLVGQGKVLVDDARLFSKIGKTYKKIDLSNSGFEDYNSNGNPKNWFVENQIFIIGPNKINPISGKASFEIKSKDDYIKGAIFDLYPKTNEYFDKELIHVLKCRVPLVLWSDSKGTIGKNTLYPFNAGKYIVGGLTYSLNDENVRLADIIITWNVMQHFFPYFEYLSVDWEAQQKQSLQKAIVDNSPDNFKRTLENMLEPLTDAHSKILYEDLEEKGAYPYIAEMVENKVVITKSLISKLIIGDVITHINGKPIENLLKEKEKYISGSPQWKISKCLNFGELANEKAGDSVLISIDRSGKQSKIKISMIQLSEIYKSYKLNNNPFRTLNGNIYYIDLGTVTMDEIKQNLEVLKKAKGIIIDLRSYPENDILNLFTYLIDSTIDSPSWYVPTIIYPDREKIKYFFSNWQIEPNNLFLQCKKIFLFDNWTLSAGETLASIIKFNKLGMTLGNNTGGTNGNINGFKILGNLGIIFTGMKVLNADGSGHFIKGVEPDIYVKKTIKAVKEGRDEYIEKAIELLNKQ